MADDVGHHLIHVLPALGLCGCGKAGIEGLAFKLGDLGVLGGGFAQKAFAVELADQGAGFLPLAVYGRAGGAAFGEEDFCEETISKVFCIPRISASLLVASAVSCASFAASWPCMEPVRMAVFRPAKP